MYRNKGIARAIGSDSNAAEKRCQKKKARLVFQTGPNVKPGDDLLSR